MFHSAPASAGKQVGHGVWSIRLAVARVTWNTSLALSGFAICLRAAASIPAECTSAATPAVTGMAADVEPSGVGTEKSACAPYEVSVERERKVLVSASFGADWPIRFDWSATIELPGQTCGKRMPSVWSADSKSFEADASTVPCR